MAFNTGDCLIEVGRVQNIKISNILKISFHKRILTCLKVKKKHINLRTYFSWLLIVDSWGFKFMDLEFPKYRYIK